MGCGSSNQVHQIHNPQTITNGKLQRENKQQQYNTSSLFGKCYMFGQTSAQRKVLLYNAKNHEFVSISCRIRIPVAIYKMEPIEILYEQSQEVILPQLKKRGPNPPFCHMFGTVCRAGVIFLCGGTNFQYQQVYNQSYFYVYDSEKRQPKPKSTMSTMINQSNMKEQGTNRTSKYIKFQPTTSMSVRRYSHTGVYFQSNQRNTKNEYIYIFGGRNIKHQAIDSCQRFDIFTRKWKDITSMYTPRAQSCSFIFLQNIYVFGGVSNYRQYPQTIEVYSPRYDTWRLLNIRLHRGIRSCSVISPNYNQILILGGITCIGNSGQVQQQRRLSTMIRVNLLLQTYKWQGDMPQSISSAKYVYQSVLNAVVGQSIRDETEQGKVNYNNGDVINTVREPLQNHHSINKNNKINNNTNQQQQNSNNLIIFSNSNDSIYTYRIQNNINQNIDQEKWSQVHEKGYKNYVPVGQLSGFTAVGQNMQVKADISILSNNALNNYNSNHILQYKMNNFAWITQFFIIGTQNYPCIIKYNPTKHKLQLKQISMALHTRSNMCISSLSTVKTINNPYLIVGGHDYIHLGSSSQMFILQNNKKQQKINDKMTFKSAIQLQSVIQGRHCAGIVSYFTKSSDSYEQIQLFIIGGIKFHQNNKSLSKKIQKYTLNFQHTTKQSSQTQKQAQTQIKIQKSSKQCQSLLKPLSNIKTCIICDQHNKHIVIYGGKQQNNSISTLVQVYNADSCTISSYAQFPCLLQFATSFIKCQLMDYREVKDIDFEACQQMLEIGQYYSSKSSIQKQQLNLPVVNNSVSFQKSVKEEKNKNVNLKQLSLLNIPQKNRKIANSDNSQEQDLIAKQIDQLAQDHKNQTINSKKSKNPAKVPMALTISDVQDLKNKKQQHLTTQNHMEHMLSSFDHSQQQQHHQFLQSTEPLLKQNLQQMQTYQKLNQQQKQNQNQNIELEFINLAEQRKNNNMQTIQIQNNKKQKNIQDLSSQQSSMITKNMEMQKQQLRNIIIYQKQYYILRMYAYGLAQQQERVVNDEHNCISKIRLFYLLINKKNKAISLLRDNNFSQVLLAATQPIKFTHCFTVKNQPYLHCFIDMRYQPNEKQQQNTLKKRKQQKMKNKSSKNQYELIHNQQYDTNNKNKKIMIYQVNISNIKSQTIKKINKISNQQNQAQNLAQGSINVNKMEIQVEGLNEQVDANQFSLSQEYY